MQKNISENGEDVRFENQQNFDSEFSSAKCPSFWKNPKNSDLVLEQILIFFFEELATTFSVKKNWLELETYIYLQNRI